MIINLKHKHYEEDFIIRSNALCYITYIFVHYIYGSLCIDLLILHRFNKKLYNYEESFIFAGCASDGVVVSVFE